ncbi:9547_t:CDS:2 [Cetraspora pellucida]|uniref:9547_t:CDS:1 n=1 Tax=Cetraspora pellucida TaxID=1433469 RepID=A0A9N8Z4N6_9GLOM|nr:9547_t:CDS:2 [Cetraspora pellucida]
MAKEIKSYTPTGHIQRSAYNLVAQWVKNAWDAIDPSLIHHFFKCCRISNAQDGSKEHLIFDYDLVTKNNASNNGNYVYLSNESSDINIEDHQRIENIETYFSQEKEDSIEKYKDDYYEDQELNYKSINLIYMA